MNGAPLRPALCCIVGSLLLFGLAGCGVSGGDSGQPHWFYTCGDPVCRGATPQAGVQRCTTETVGQLCASAGQQCDPADGCNRRLVCTTLDPTDPKVLDGGCPR